MAVDWVARLREQGRFARRMASEVPEALADPALTAEEADQLYRTVENCARSFDAIVAEMERARLDPAYLRAAETVSELWLDLARRTADGANRAFQARSSRQEPAVGAGARRRPG